MNVTQMFLSGGGSIQSKPQTTRYSKLQVSGFVLRTSVLLRKGSGNSDKPTYSSQTQPLSPKSASVFKTLNPKQNWFGGSAHAVCTFVFIPCTISASVAHGGRKKQEKTELVIRASGSEHTLDSSSSPAESSNAFRVYARMF